MAYTIDPELRYRMRFIHPEKIHADLPGATPKSVARLFSLSTRHYRQVLAWFEQGLDQAVDRLLTDDELVDALDHLPFGPGTTVVAMGDSITDDYQSWFELLIRLWERRHRDSRVRFLNLGISGDTTTEMVARSLGVVEAHPDWVICLAGTNDARRHGPDAAGTLVSLDETRRNYGVLERCFREVCGATSIWITPPPVIEAQIIAHWFLGAFELSWTNEDLAARAGLLAGLGFQVAAVRDAFGLPADPELLLEDGLHPSLAGQELILRGVVRAISAAA